MAKSVYERFGKSDLGGTGQSGLRHTVTGNDTLPSIGAKYFENEGYSSELWRQIAEENKIDDLDAVSTGDVLTIPTPKPKST